MGEKKEAVFQQIRVVMLAVALPFVMAVGPVAGYIGGEWIGDRVGHGSSGKLIGLLLGFVAGIFQTVIIIRRILRELK